MSTTVMSRLSDLKIQVDGLTTSRSCSSRCGYCLSSSVGALVALQLLGVPLGHPVFSFSKREEQSVTNFALYCLKKGCIRPGEAHAVQPWHTFGLRTSSGFCSGNCKTKQCPNLIRREQRRYSQAGQGSCGAAEPHFSGYKDPPT